MSPQRNPTVGDLLRPLVDVTDRGVHDGDGFTSWHDHIAAAAEIASALRARLDPAKPPHVGVLLGNTPFFSSVLVAAALGRLVPVGLNPPICSPAARGRRLRTDRRRPAAATAPAQDHQRQCE